MPALPPQLPKAQLRDYAQLPQRAELAALTDSIAALAHGVLAMERHDDGGYAHITDENADRTHVHADPILRRQVWHVVRDTDVIMVVFTNLNGVGLPVTTVRVCTPHDASNSQPYSKPSASAEAQDVHGRDGYRPPAPARGRHSLPDWRPHRPHSHCDARLLAAACLRAATIQLRCSSWTSKLTMLAVPHIILLMQQHFWILHPHVKSLDSG